MTLPTHFLNRSGLVWCFYISRLIIALGEHAELETQALISERRKYINEPDMTVFSDLSARVGQVTHGLLRSLE